MLAYCHLSCISSSIEECRPQLSSHQFAPSCNLRETKETGFIISIDKNFYPLTIQLVNMYEFRAKILGYHKHKWNVLRHNKRDALSALSR